MGIEGIAGQLHDKRTVIALILFGSAARDQQRPFSDIDLCIVTSGVVPEEERLDLKSYGSHTIEIHLLDELPLAVRFRVVSEGKLVFCKDALALHRVIADTVRQYLDGAWFIDMHSRHAIGISR